jgi:hypothetical protein
MNCNLKSPLVAWTHFQSYYFISIAGSADFDNFNNFIMFFINKNVSVGL